MVCLRASNFACLRHGLQLCCCADRDNAQLIRGDEHPTFECSLCGRAVSCPIPCSSSRRSFFYRNGV
ncbi:hypothetical protein E5170_21665 [Pseudomonas atacamensis]|uniref:Uncharacterized protein n=1 Tax=Pseudomonas atacamensis TaxID=2565368 RepID=A0AAQ2D932_9PSED|nr:hypothetical protein EGJ55_26310 [Pseudomonas moraviensis]THF28672.1 hypothetical protein E5170_21665 [Pseudomonas atacamensis]